MKTPRNHLVVLGVMLLASGCQGDRKVIESTPEQTSRRDTVLKSINPSLHPFSSEKAMILVGWQPGIHDSAITAELKAAAPGYSHCSSAAGYLLLAYDQFVGTRGTKIIDVMQRWNSTQGVTYHTSIYEGGTEVAVPHASCI